MWKSIALGGALLVATTTAAQAQPCNTRDEVMTMLGNRYQEAPVARGVTSNGKMIEVLKSSQAADQDTWTIVITSPNGLTCLVAAGEGLRFLEALAQGPEA